MQTDGYTVFTGPSKHGNKPKTVESKDVGDVYKKAQHCNKNQLDGQYVAKIMNAEDDYKPLSMPHDLRIAIAQARNAKGWNQDQFSKMIQVPKSEVNSWEAGKSVPAGNLIAKMDKVLGVKLPRPSKNK